MQLNMSLLGEVSARQIVEMMLISNETNSVL